MNEIVVVPFILFILFVAPLWLILHYKERARREQAAAAAANAPASTGVNADLAAVAEKMEKRIAALEAVLDAESPGWRQRHEQ